MQAFKNNRINYIIYAVISICILVGAVIYANIRNKSLDTHARYTIGMTYGHFWALKDNNPTVKYYYYVNNKKYTGQYNYKDHINTNGGIYYVKYSSINPSNSIIILDAPVKDNIAISDVPPNGWDKIPNNGN